MDAYEQEIFTMKTEAHRLKLENMWLKNEIMAHNGGQPIELPDSIVKKVPRLPPIGSSGGSGAMGSVGRGPWTDMGDDGEQFTEMSKPPTPNSMLGDWVDHVGADFSGRNDYQDMQLMQEFELEIIRLR